jgi:hypothetical protein
MVAGERVFMAFAPGSIWSGLQPDVREFYLAKARRDNWSLGYLASMIERDHDLVNGRKASEFSLLNHWPHERHQEYLFANVKMRTACDHRQKTLAAGDRLFRYTDADRAQNILDRNLVDTTEIDEFLKPVAENQLPQQDWWWLEPGDLGLDNPYGVERLAGREK